MFGCGSLPDDTEKTLRGRIENILSRHTVAKSEEIVRELTDEVSWAFAGYKHKLEQSGAGRPANGPANLLSVMKSEGIGLEAAPRKSTGSWELSRNLKLSHWLRFVKPVK